MLPSSLRGLFWDTNVETFDPERFPRYTIARVIEHGNPMAVSWLRRTFSADQIVDVLQTDRRLSLRSANFWALLYALPNVEVAAFRDQR